MAKIVATSTRKKRRLVSSNQSNNLYTVDELNWDNIDDLSNPERVR
jgi:hypothetical protein